MIRLLKLIFACVLIFMCYEVITTSLQSNLFEQWHFLGNIPWMKATLWDFYANVLVIYLWVCYKETSFFKRAVWLILLVCLGSIASCIYILIQLFKLKKDDTIKELLIQKN